METNKFKWTSYFIAKFSFSSLAMIIAASFFVVTAFGQGTPLYNNNGGSAPGTSPSGLATGATTKSGVAAPAGTQWSEVQNNAGNTAESNTSAGSTCTGTFRLADDFTVPAGQTWTISSIDTYAYQTGSSPTTSPFTGATIRIWNGAPPNGMVVYGDTTTNRLGTTTFSGLYRIFNTIAPPPGSAPGTTRPIFRNQILTAGLTLTAGTYWIDYAFSGPATAFCPSTTVVDTRGLPGWNALQLTAAPSTWTAVVDAGNPAAAPDVPQDFPFQIFGTCAGNCGVTTPPTAIFDFDGDGRTDYAVLRQSGNSLEWLIRQSQNGAFLGLPWGLTTDTPTPGDFDGDGKTDLNVWRSGNYLLRQSSNNAFASIPWGTAGDEVGREGDYDGDGKDDPTVVRNVSGNKVFYIRQSTNGALLAVTWGLSTDTPIHGADWDGDGKDDVAVYRVGTGGQITFLIRNSSTGQLQAISWGQKPDDIVMVEDFDGDGKADPAVFRRFGDGNWYIRQSSTGTLRTVSFGIAGANGDLAVPGDYDGDGKTDIAVYRRSEGRYYVLRSSNNMLETVQWGTATDTPVQILRTY